MRGIFGSVDFRIFIYLFSKSVLKIKRNKMLDKFFKILKNYLHSRKYCKILGITFDSHKITSLEKVLGF